MKFKQIVKSKEIKEEISQEIVDKAIPKILQAVIKVYPGIKNMLKSTTPTDKDKYYLMFDCKIPPGLDSLFAKLSLSISVLESFKNMPDGYYSLISWQYNHPRGGSNGHTFLQVNLLPDGTVTTAPR